MQCCSQVSSKRAVSALRAAAKPRLSTCSNSPRMAAVAIQRSRPCSMAEASVCTAGSAKSNQSSTTFVSNTISGARVSDCSHDEIRVLGRFREGLALAARECAQYNHWLFRRLPGYPRAHPQDSGAIYAAPWTDFKREQVNRSCLPSISSFAMAVRSRR
jgi:hypothetical protein